MQAPVEITLWHWVGFIGCIVLFLAFDLGLFHRHARVVRVREALGWTILWVSLSLAFTIVVVLLRGRRGGLEFVTGYFVELSLSLDNVFVVALIFLHFRVPEAHQHRVLFWGVLGALVMRGLMIWAGAKLIQRYEWVLYCLALLLLVAGGKMLFSRGETDPNRSLLLRFARKLLPITRDFEGQKLLTRVNGRRMLTPLFLVLLMVESSDLIFAVDSIPAVFGVTRDPFIVFTSNVFAILGLRSMYFMLAGVIGKFRHLKTGLAMVLIFISLKMLLSPPEGKAERWFQLEIHPAIALGVVICIIGVAIGASMISAKREGGQA